KRVDGDERVGRVDDRAGDDLVDVHHPEAEIGRQLALVACRRLPDVGHLESGIQNPVAGRGDAPEVGAVRVEVDLARLIELVAVQVVPGEDRVRGGVPVEGVGIRVAEHVVVQTEGRLDYRLAADVPRDAHPRYGTGQLLHFDLRIASGREHR